MMMEEDEDHQCRHRQQSQGSTEDNQIQEGSWREGPECPQWGRAEVRQAELQDQQQLEQQRQQ